MLSVINSGPLIIPLYFKYNKDINWLKIINSEVLVGPSILIAPILKKGQITR